MNKLMSNKSINKRTSVGKKIILAVILITAFTGCANVNWQAYRAVNKGNWGEAIEIYEKKSKALSEFSQQDLQLLSASYTKMKSYKKLAPCLDEMERRIEAGRDTYSIGGGYEEKLSQSLAMFKTDMLVDFGQYDKAIDVYKKYDYLLTDKGDFLSYTPLNYHYRRIGVAYALKGDTENAEKYLKLLTDLDESLPDRCVGWALGSTTRLCIGAYRLQAAWDGGSVSLLMAMKRYQEALDWIDETIKASRVKSNWVDFGITAEEGYKSMGVTVFGTASKFMKAKALYETEQYETSKQAYEELLELPQLSDNGYIYWNTLFDRGRIALGEDKRDEAIDFFTRAVEVLESQRANIGSDLAKIGFVGDKQQVYQYLIETLLAENRTVEAFEYVERAKARSLVELLASKKEFGSTLETPQLTAMLDELENAELVPLDLNTTATAPQSTQRSARAIAVRQKLKAQVPELKALVTVSALKLREIQSLLPEDEVLVEYYYSGSTLTAFVVNRTSILAVKLDEDGLVDQVRKFRSALSDVNSDRHMQLGLLLYKQLVSPLADKIEHKKLLVVAHGSLHYLPFNALNDGRHFLIDRFSIRVLPSASVMEFLKMRTGGQQKDLLVLGNPDLGNPDYDLVFAQQEAEAIAQEFTRASVLLRRQATETAIKSHGVKFKRVHFASHGEFDSKDPLNSGLLLAADSENDGRLTVSELYNLRLHADLVTLSACETALGKVASGDDVIGFTRGFLYAGASSIVSSLWSVDDRATRDLMVDFYRNLGTDDKVEALRHAQLSIKEKYRHPYYWAAFQLTGVRR